MNSLTPCAFSVRALAASTSASACQELARSLGPRAAVGPANLWGANDEPQWKLLRLERLQYGPQFLSGAVMVSTPPDAGAILEKRAGIATAGLLGSNALLNYRIGIDYAHKMAYFEIGTTFKAPDFDVVGLILRPEADGRFTVIGVADFDGKPSVPEVQSGDLLISVDNIPAPGSTMGLASVVLGLAWRAGWPITLSAGVEFWPA